MLLFDWSATKGSIPDEGVPGPIGNAIGSGAKKVEGALCALRLGGIATVAALLSISSHAGCKKAPVQPRISTTSVGVTPAPSANPAVPRPHSDTEVASNPPLLLDRRVGVGQLSFHGVSLGDDESTIPKMEVGSRDAAGGYTLLSKLGGYVVIGGHVAEIWTVETFQALGVADITGIKTCLGQPKDEIDVGDGTKILEFPSRHMTVLFSPTGSKCSITISETD